MKHIARSTPAEHSAIAGRAFAGAAVAVALTAASATTAHAQSMDYGALEQLFGEPVTTSATGSPQRAANVPANMEIITADTIRRSGADNIPDILQFVAGVDVRRYGFAQAEVSVRGYNQQFSPRLLVLINGRQVYLDDYGRTAWELLPVQLDEIRQIEVVKGPNSALFGFNAVGGVINIITYDPLLDSTNAVTVRGGTQGSASGSVVVTLHDGEQAGVRLTAGGFRADEYSTRGLPPELGPYNQSPYNYAIGADSRLKLTSDVILSLEATATRGSRFDVIPAPTYGDDAYDTNSVKAGLAADTPYGLFNITAYRNELQFETVVQNSRSLVTNEVYVVKADDVFKVGNDHTVRLGVEYRDNAASSPVFGGTIGYNVFAGSAMWNWQIAPELAVSNAVRLDHLVLRYAGTTVPGIQYTLSDYNASRLTELSFNSGIVYKPTANDTVRLLAARGIQAPSLVDFGFQVNSVVGPLSVSFIGNPTLDAASVMNFEVDYDRAFALIGAVLRTAVYYQKTDDLLASPLNTPLGLGAGGLVSYAQNVGSSTAVGGEIGFHEASGSAFRWNASYALISITDDLSFGPLTGSSSLLDYEHGSPASVVNLGAGYSWDQFEVDAQSRWQSHFTDYAATAVSGGVAPVRIDNYITVNARIAHRVTDEVTLALSGQQLGEPRLLTAAGTPVERRIIASITGRF